MLRQFNRFVFAAVVILLAPFGFAQPPAGTPAPAANADAGERRGDLDFPGGTVKQYVDAVAKSFGSANAGVFPGVESLAVSPVRLKQVTLEESMHLLHALSGGNVVIQNFHDVHAVVPHSNQPHGLVKQIRVWPLAKVLARIKTDDALSAVKAALDLAGPDAEVKFHPQTTILIVSGTVAEIDAVDQVIDRLESVATWHERGEAESRGPSDAQQALEAAMKRIADMEVERMGLKNTIRLQEQELESLRKAR